jgi:hypothetical protein
MEIIAARKTVRSLAGRGLAITSKSLPSQNTIFTRRESAANPHKDSFGRA